MNKFLLVTIILSMALAQEAFAWGDPHRTIAAAAVSTLPQWQQELIKDEIKDYTYTYCLYPDSSPSDPVTMPYVMKDMGIRMHIPKSRPENQEILDYYIPLVAGKLKAGNIQEAMRQFGSLTHYIEDSSCPGHVRYGDSAVPADSTYFLMMEFFKQYMDVPPEKVNAQLHGVLDGAYAGCFTREQIVKSMEGYKPVLLGATIEEALFHLGQRHEDMHVASAKHLIPLLQAYFKDDKETFNKHILAAGQGSAKLVADTLYTLICISQGKVDPAEAAALPKEINLADVTIAKGMPFYWRTNYANQPVRNASGASGFVATEPKGLTAEPLKLLMEDGQVREFKKGYGVAVGTRYLFLLQPDVFKTFTVTVGNQSGIGEHGFSSFQIFLDGKVVADSGMMDGKQAAKVLKVDLGKARQLTIQTTGKENVKSALCHPIWAEPVLSK